MARRIRLTTRDRTSRVDRLAAERERGGEGLAGAWVGGPALCVSPPDTTHLCGTAGRCYRSHRGGRRRGPRSPASGSRAPAPSGSSWWCRCSWPRSWGEKWVGGGPRPPRGTSCPRAGAHLEVPPCRVHVPQGIVALPVPVLIDLQEAGDAWGRRGPQPMGGGSKPKISPWERGRGVPGGTGVGLTVEGAVPHLAGDGGGVGDGAAPLQRLVEGLGVEQHPVVEGGRDEVHLGAQRRFGDGAQPGVPVPTSPPAPDHPAPPCPKRPQLHPVPLPPSHVPLSPPPSHVPSSIPCAPGAPAPSHVPCPQLNPMSPNNSSSIPRPLSPA